MKAQEAEAAADEILAANDNPPPKFPRVRFRGGRPAWNWLKRQDERAAAALWLVARRCLPDAANDNHQTDTAGMGVDRRKNGKPRGRDPKGMSPARYVALPSVLPRLGDALPKPVEPRGHHGWYEIKSQEWTHPDAVFTEATRFSFYAPGVANGASFMGAKSGLGQPKIHKSRGDVRRVEEPDLPAMPERITKIIESVLARADLAGVGKALGYRGGYADRVGKKAMIEAGRWALQATAA